LVVGENPAVTMPDAARFWAALGRLEWLVAMDGYETETATFWRRPGTRPEDIATEVFLLPAAGALEREGRITNAWGMVQSHPALVAPPGQCKTVGWLLDQLSPPAQREKQPGPPPAHALAARTRLFAAELADGPLPEHYEPCESPVANAFSPQQCNPVAIRPQDGVAVGGAAAGEFPIVATIVRIGEHSQSGLATRNLPWLVEMVPGPFVELSKSLAQSRGIRNGQPAAIRTARGEIVLPAVVTGRLRPLRCGDREIEQVAIVGQFGWCGQASGPTAAVLAPAAFDPNSGTPEMKGFLCEVARGGDWGLGIRD
jgi:anaerobic selenocysteine-containing dehydrogenase